MIKTCINGKGSEPVIHSYLSSDEYKIQPMDHNPKRSEKNSKANALCAHTQVRNVRENWRTEQLLMMKLTAADESYSSSHCCLGTGFIALHSRDEGPHLCISGEGQIQGGVEARRIMQNDDDQGQKEGKRSAGSSRKKQTWPWPHFLRGRGFKLTAALPLIHHIRPPIEMSTDHQWASLFTLTNMLYYRISPKLEHAPSESKDWWFGWERMPEISIRTERS